MHMADEKVADRSRSRSTARTANENLLVSLDEAVLPPQITKVRKDDEGNLTQQSPLPDAT